MGRAIKRGNVRIAVAYLRCSTEDQRLSPEAQRAAIETWAAREGVSVVAWCVDQGVSGGANLEERTALVGALSALRTHGAGVLVVAKRDRLARDRFVALTIERAVKQAGSVLVSADGAGNGSNPQDELMRGMLDLMSEYERSLIRTRTMQALAVKKARGERVGAIPYGFQLGSDGKTLEANEAEQSTIRLVQSLLGEGKRIADIVRILEDLGLKSRVGKPFMRTQIVHMLA